MINLPSGSSLLQRDKDVVDPFFLQFIIVTVEGLR